MTENEKKTNREQYEGESEKRQHRHHRHHHYLMEIDEEREYSASGSKKKERTEPKKLKKFDLSEKPLAAWLLLITMLIAILFLLLMPHNVFVSKAYSISKWTAVSVCFSFTAMGSILYLMRERLTSQYAENRVKQAIKGATLVAESSGLLILLFFAVTNGSIVSSNALNPAEGYITRSELEAFLDDYQMGASHTESDRINLTTPEIVNLAPEALHSVLSDQSGYAVNDILAQFRGGGTRLDVGYSANVSFTVEGSLADSISYITVEISEDEAMTDTRLFTLEATDRSVSIPYLKTGTKYYYRVNTFLSDNGNMNVRNRSGSFTTAETPRILSVDGVRNVRDVGGWLKTVDGKKIKQDLLFRGTEFDGQVQPEYKATEVGLSDMKNILNIKSDFDLRAHNSSNPLGVTHKSFAIPTYEEIFKEDGKAKVKKLFSELANPVNYPIYMHCTYGVDRTGVMMYLLELMLGVDEESALKEYEFSALFIKGINRDTMFPVITGLEEYEGRSMQERVRSYLNSCGVTEEEMQSIADILLE